MTLNNPEQPGKMSNSRSKRYNRPNRGGRPKNVYIPPKKILESKGLPPNDFRTLSVYPTHEEILSLTNSFIRKNLINGRYDNVEHYLDVHFRLLKEDFVAPLREGIREYMQLNRGTNTNNCNLKSSQVAIHVDVIFRSRTFENQRRGVILEFSNKKSRESIFSPHSERLKYGSLAVFTKDFFASVAFGRVINQDFINNQLVIGFEDSKVGYDLYLGVPYLMVECKALFEPYYHVLKALQRKTEFDFPMKSYLIDVDASLKQPDYLDPIFSCFTIRNRYVHLFGSNWPSADQLQLNSTQFSAFKAALTQKFVVIQGPPGTGKTYLALEIVKTLLYNRKFWYNRTPILIVCYTNHALDQFVEKLIPTTSAIVRVGGRSKNEKLVQFNLKNLRVNYKGSLGLKGKIKQVLRELHMYKDMLNKISELSRNSIVEKLVCLRQYCTELRSQVDADIMKNNLVVAMTTTGAASLQTTLQALQCPIIVVEEAAEVMESHITVSLTKHCKHLILIGDHQQLRPSTADYRIEQDFNLGISMFERMVLNNIQCHVLGVQHRMRPEIVQLIVPHIYPKLENHYSVSTYPSIVGITSNLYFINHEHQEEDVDDSHSNLHEARFLINLACYLRKVGYKPTDIAILATYSSQMHALHDQSKHFQSWLKDVRICTVDNFQGEESKIILLSLVRNNRKGRIGFLKTENRICVALSRAKEGLYIMGNMEMLSRQSKIWEKINQVLLKQKSIGDYLTVYCRFHPLTRTSLKEPEDFLRVPNGGCLKICGKKLGCGHHCSQVCHPTSPCRCFINEIRLACGHKRKLECNSYNKLLKNPGYHGGSNNWQCTVPCEKRIEPCGHICPYRCHNNIDPNHLNQRRCRECYNKIRIIQAEKYLQYSETRWSTYNQVAKIDDRSSLIWPFNVCCIL